MCPLISRVAVVSLPKIHAEAALKELKGFNAKGHPLKPESTEPKSTTAEPGTTGEEVRIFMFQRGELNLTSFTKLSPVISLSQRLLCLEAPATHTGW